MSNKLLTVFLDQKASLKATVVVVLVVVVISSLKMHTVFLICSAAQRNFAYAFIAHIPYRSTVSDFYILS